jgi:hypothetical protein
VSDEPKKHRFLITGPATKELSDFPAQIQALLNSGALRAIQAGIGSGLINEDGDG